MTTRHWVSKKHVREWLTVFGLAAYLDKKPPAAWKYAQRIGLDTRLVGAARGVEVAVIPGAGAHYREVAK
jgi:hypothetical protein